MYIRITEQLALVNHFERSLLVLHNACPLQHTKIACTGALCVMSQCVSGHKHVLGGSWTLQDRGHLSFERLCLLSCWITRYPPLQSSLVIRGSLVSNYSFSLPFFFKLNSSLLDLMSVINLKLTLASATMQILISSLSLTSLTKKYSYILYYIILYIYI